MNYAKEDQAKSERPSELPELLNVYRSHLDNQHKLIMGIEERLHKIYTPEEPGCGSPIPDDKKSSDTFVNNLGISLAEHGRQISRLSGILDHLQRLI